MSFSIAPPGLVALLGISLNPLDHLIGSHRLNWYPMAVLDVVYAF